MPGYALLFTGTVGAGKTTHIHLLSHALQQQTKKVTRVRLKSNGFLAYYLLKAISKLVGIRVDRKYLLRDLYEYNPTLLQRLWLVWFPLDALSVLLTTLIKVLIPLKHGYIVLCEDFLPAIVADYYYFVYALHVLPLRLVKYVSKLLISQIPRNAIIFFLDAPNSLLQQRWQRRHTRTELPQYLNAQRQIPALGYPHGVQLIQVDTGHIDVQTTQQHITTCLQRTTHS